MTSLEFVLDLATSLWHLHYNIALEIPFSAGVNSIKSAKGPKVTYETIDCTPGIPGLEKRNF